MAWESSAIQGPRIKDGAEKADAFRDGTFNSPLYWRKLYTKVETTGAEKVEGHDTYKVVMTPKEGSPTTHYYDKTSGLLLKTQATRVTASGAPGPFVGASGNESESSPVPVTTA